MTTLITRLRQQPYWIALIIFIALTIWVASGSLSADDNVTKKKSFEAPLPNVKVETFYADEIARQVTLYGRTEPDRITMLRAEVQGQVTEIFVEEGQTVSKGEKLVTIDANDLQQRLVSVKAQLAQRKLELQGAESLGQKGYQSQVTLAQAKANLAASLAQVKALELAIDNTVIVAPYDGVVNERMVEVGDLLREGDNIATVVDLDPIIIQADVTESYIHQLKVGQKALGRMVTGERLAGQVRYISSVSNEGTNTFSIEVEVPNQDRVYRAGMSTELELPFGVTHAIKVTPAVLALAEDGSLGVKTVAKDIVKFVPIDIVQSDSEGVWLSGFGEQATVIILGHGYVRDGDRVNVVTDQHNAQVNQ